MKKIILLCCISFSIIVLIIFFGSFVYYKNQGYKISFQNQSAYSLFQYTGTKEVTQVDSFTQKFTFAVSSVDPNMDSIKIVTDKLQKSFETLSRPTVKISWLATASPEYSKNGFEKSIQINTLEPENQAYAWTRLNRTIDVVSHNLATGVTFTTTTREAKELQLKDSNEVQQVLKNPVLLSSMRYVLADIKVSSSKVTTISCPQFVSLMWWPWLLCLSCLLLSRINWTKKKTTSNKPAGIKKTNRLAKIVQASISSKEEKEPKEQIYNLNFVWFLFSLLSIYALYQKIGWRTIPLVLIISSAYGLYVLLKKKNIMTYVPKPDKETDGDRKIPTFWIWVVVTPIIGALGYPIIRSVGQLLIEYEVFRWILFSMIMYILAWMFYIYKEPLTNRLKKSKWTTWFW